MRRYCRPIGVSGKLGVQVNHKLVQTLSKEALEEGGKKLGILQNGTFVFDNEDQTSILMDYCIHNVWIDGTNAVHRYFEQSPPRDGSDEMVLLTSMLEGYYSLIEVIRTEPGRGIRRCAITCAAVPTFWRTLE